jgi:hypothetical protein
VKLSGGRVIGTRGFFFGNKDAEIKTLVSASNLRLPPPFRQDNAFVSTLPSTFAWTVPVVLLVIA